MNYTTMAEMKEGKLHKFPKSNIINGLKSCETVEQYENLKLFESKDERWYIYYSRYNKTGSFDTKGQAIKWFERKGR